MKLLHRFWILTSAVIALGSPLSTFAAEAPCFNLENYLTQLRALPDKYYVHHQLVDLSVESAEGGEPASDLAVQHALNLFYHPNRVTQGIAAARNGTPFRHIFSIYQQDCAKVVTGNIFSDTDPAIYWEVLSHTDRALLFKRVVKESAPPARDGDLTVMVRAFQKYAPNVFIVKSGYNLRTLHKCATGEGTDAGAEPKVGESKEERSYLSVTELYIVDDSSKNPPEQLGDSLKALMKKHPRMPAPGDRRGEFMTPVSATSDSACRP